MDLWVSLVQKLVLKREEATLVAPFLRDPHGRGFLTAADVLKSHGCLNESIELLNIGVKKHSAFVLARVALAREYLDRGMHSQARQLLERAPVDLDSNAAAQRILFKCGILARDLEFVELMRRHLKQQSMFDEEIKLISDSFMMGGIESARRIINEAILKRGFVIAEDHDDSHLTKPTSSSLSSSIKPNQMSINEQLETELDGDYEVVPLNRVFSSAKGSQKFEEVSQGLKLDSATLADIYEKQNHFKRALEVYRRLLKVDPHNKSYLTNVERLRKLARQQSRKDYSLNPEVMDNVHQIEILDQQISFYKVLLDRLAGAQVG
jgi:tetratricopeptide (TPR) repeat protein